MVNGVVVALALVQAEGTAAGEAESHRVLREDLDEVVLIGGLDPGLLYHPEELSATLLVGTIFDI